LTFRITIFNEIYDICQVLIGLTWNFVNFLDSEWTEILFEYICP
jgi:hypothetical protein